MSDYTTNFPPQTYSSSFYLNSLVEDEKTLVTKSAISTVEGPTNPPLLDCFISTLQETMNIAKNLFALAMFPLLVRTQQTRQCVPGNLKVVSFPTLEAYQGSQNSFDVSHPTYCGNSIVFTFKTIDRLLRNSFISFGSNSIIQVDLENKRIQKIDDGAFNQLFCMHNLKLRRNNITSLGENVFEGLGNLRLLDLSENSMARVDAFEFHRLNNLLTLNLSRNKIIFLSSYAFANLTSVVSLDLSFNKIRSISPNVFAPLLSLKELYLSRNELSNVAPEKWVGLTKMELLDLAGNSLSSFDTSYSFAFSNLVKLNLSGNYLTYVDAFDMRRNLPKLRTIDITENNWLCETLEVLKHNLIDSKIGLYGVVNCSLSGVYKPSTTESPLTPSTSTVATTTRRSRDYTKEVFVQNGEVLFTNKKVLENVQHLENVVVCLFVVVIIFVVIEMGVRIGLCNNLYNRMTGRNRGYLDGSDTEHVVLMGR